MTSNNNEAKEVEELSGSSDHPRTVGMSQEDFEARQRELQAKVDQWMKKVQPSANAYEASFWDQTLQFEEETENDWDSNQQDVWSSDFAALQMQLKEKRKNKFLTLQLEKEIEMDREVLKQAELAIPPSPATTSPEKWMDAVSDHFFDPKCRNCLKHYLYLNLLKCEFSDGMFCQCETVMDGKLPDLVMQWEGCGPEDFSAQWAKDAALICKHLKPHENPREVGRYKEDYINDVNRWYNEEYCTRDCIVCEIARMPETRSIKIPHHGDKVIFKFGEWSPAPEWTCHQIGDDQEDVLIFTPSTEEGRAHMFMWHELSDLNDNKRPYFFTEEDEEDKTFAKPFRNARKVLKMPPYPGFKGGYGENMRDSYEVMFNGGLYWDCDVFLRFEIYTYHKTPGDAETTTFVIKNYRWGEQMRREEYDGWHTKQNNQQIYFVDLSTEDCNIELYDGKLYDDPHEPQTGHYSKSYDRHEEGMMKFIEDRLARGLSLSEGEKPQMKKTTQEFSSQVKSHLNLVTQQLRLNTPVYTVNHKIEQGLPMMKASVEVNGETYSGGLWHRTKRSAESEAAQVALDHSNEWSPEKEDKSDSEEEDDAMSSLLAHSSSRGDFLQTVLLGTYGNLDAAIKAGMSKGYITQQQSKEGEKELANLTVSRSPTEEELDEGFDEEVMNDIEAETIVESDEERVANVEKAHIDQFASVEENKVENDFEQLLGEPEVDLNAKGKEKSPEFGGPPLPIRSDHKEKKKAFDDQARALIEIESKHIAKTLATVRYRLPLWCRQMNEETLTAVLVDWCMDSIDLRISHRWAALPTDIKCNLVIRGRDQKEWDYETDETSRKALLNEMVMLKEQLIKDNRAIRVPLQNPVSEKATLAPPMVVTKPAPEPVLTPKVEDKKPPPPMLVREREERTLEEIRRDNAEKIEEAKKRIPANAMPTVPVSWRGNRAKMREFYNWFQAKTWLGNMFQGLMVWAGLVTLTSVMDICFVLGIPPLLSVMIGVCGMIMVLCRGYMYSVVAMMALRGLGWTPWAAVFIVWTGVSVIMTLLASAAMNAVKFRNNKLINAKEAIKEVNQGLIDDCSKQVGSIINTLGNSMNFPSRSVGNLRSLIGLIKDFPSAMKVITEFWSVYLFNPETCVAEADMPIWFMEEINKVYILKGLKGHEIAPRIIPAGFTYFIYTLKTQSFVELQKDIPAVALKQLSLTQGTIIMMKKDDIVLPETANLLSAYTGQTKDISFEVRAYDWLGRKVLDETKIGSPGVGYTYKQFVPAPQDVKVSPDFKGNKTIHDLFNIAEKIPTVVSDNAEQPQSHHLDAIRQLAAEYAAYVKDLSQQKAGRLLEWVIWRKGFVWIMAIVASVAFAFVSLMVWTYLKKEEKKDENEVVLSDGTILTPTGIIPAGEKEIEQGNVLKYNVDDDFEIIKVRSPDGRYFGYDPERMNDEFARGRKPGEVIPVKVLSNKGARELRMVVADDGMKFQGAVAKKSGKISTFPVEDEKVRKEMKHMLKEGMRTVPLDRKAPRRVVAKITENKSPVIRKSSDVKQQSIASAVIKEEKPVFEFEQAWKSTIDTRINYIIYRNDRFVCQVTKTPNGLLLNKHYKELPDLTDGQISLWNPKLGTSQIVNWDWSRVEEFKDSKDMSYLPLDKPYSHLPCVDGSAVEMCTLKDGTYAGWLMGFDPDSKNGDPFCTKIEFVKIGNELHYMADNKAGICMSVVYLDEPKKRVVGFHKSGSDPGLKCTADAVTDEILQRCYSGRPDHLF